MAISFEKMNPLMTWHLNSGDCRATRVFSGLVQPMNGIFGTPSWSWIPTQCNHFICLPPCSSHNLLTQPKSTSMATEPPDFSWFAKIGESIMGMTVSLCWFMCYCGFRRGNSATMCLMNSIINHNWIVSCCLPSVLGQACLKLTLAFMRGQWCELHHWCGSLWQETWLLGTITEGLLKMSPTGKRMKHVNVICNAMQ